MTWRLMCDSDDPGSLLPTDVAATYSDLFTSHKQVADLVESLPGTKIIFGDRGAGDPLGIASWLDSERGTLAAPDLPGKIRGMHDRGVRYVTVYHSMEAAARIEEHLSGLSYYQWVAWWGHLAGARPLHVARQFLPSNAIDVHVDLSVIHNDTWHPGLRGRALASVASDRLTRCRTLLDEAAAAVETLSP